MMPEKNNKLVKLYSVRGISKSTRSENLHLLQFGSYRITASNPRLIAEREQQPSLTAKHNRVPFFFQLGIVNTSTLRNFGCGYSPPNHHEHSDLHNG